MDLKLLLVLAIVGYCTAELKSSCPYSKLGPCECLEAYGKVFLKCRNLQSHAQLIAAMRDMDDGYTITVLEIHNSNISYVPHYLFTHSSVSKIRIFDSDMLYLFDDQLKSPDHLTEISLQRIKFEGGLDWSVLGNLGALQLLRASDTGIEYIGPPIVELQLPVESLLLENNKIEMITDLAFSNFKDLKNLVLNNNKISSLKRSMFPFPSSGLQFLDVSSNKLSSLPDDMFDGMNQLHTLRISYNSFATLKGSYMKNIFPSMFYLDVVGNPIQCDCELRWVLSDKKPYHFFGSCRDSKSGKSLKLKEMEPSDFTECVE